MFIPGKIYLITTSTNAERMHLHFRRFESEENQFICFNIHPVLRRINDTIKVTTLYVVATLFKYDSSRWQLSIDIAYSTRLHRVVSNWFVRSHSATLLAAMTLKVYVALNISRKKELMRTEYGA